MLIRHFFEQKDSINVLNAIVRVKIESFLRVDLILSRLPYPIL